MERKPTIFKLKNIGKTVIMNELIFSRNPPYTQIIEKTYIVLC